MQVGERIGRYEIHRRLAAGGMAEIFLAKLRGEAGFEKDVVLKKILPQWSHDQDFIAMLVDEAKIAVRLNHPNIVQVFELAKEGELFYIALEYVHGVDLRRLLQKVQAQKSKIPAAAALFIASEVLEGLAYAHARKEVSGKSLDLVHRDISPQNILLSFEGGVKLTDFGIAQAASRSQETVTGVLKGKFAYMSPEQANQEALDSRSDLFSLAVVLYEMLTGERLFYRGSDWDTLDRVRRCDQMAVGEALKSVPEGLREVLLKALDKKREDRFQTAKEFRDALRTDYSREALSRYLVSVFPEAGPPAHASPNGGPLREPTRTAPRFSAVPPRRRWLGVTLALLSALTLAVHLAGPEAQENPLIKSKIDLKLKETLEVIPEIDDRPIPPEIPPPVREDQSLPALADAPSEASQEASDEDLFSLLPPLVSASMVATSSKGYLSVQAIPWGTVSVDGGRVRETPVRRIALSPGRHRVLVSYEPDGISVSSSISVKSGREIVCIAKLRGGKTLTCGE